MVGPVANNVRSEQSGTKLPKHVLLFVLLTNIMTHKAKAVCLACLDALCVQIQLNV